MARKTYQLDADEAKSWRLAKLFDLRTFIGVLFVIFGVIVTYTGLTATDEEIAMAADMNLSLWVGLILLATGVIFLVWIWLKPPEPVTKAEMEARRKELEEFGTASGVHH
ncbi:MAG: hypothetical protein V9G19_23510 [Tetrasphaera sp.]